MSVKAQFKSPTGPSVGRAGCTPLITQLGQPGWAGGMSPPPGGCSLSATATHKSHSIFGLPRTHCLLIRAALLFVSCLELSPGLPRFHCIGRFYITRYRTLRRQHTTKPREQTHSNKQQIQNVKSRCDFPFPTRQRELRGEEELPTYFSNDTFCNCFY